MLAVPAGDQGYGIPVHGEINTISGGFSGGGCTASQRKKYATEVMAVEAGELDQSPELDPFFTKADLQDVVPHDNDPVVISVVTAGRKVHRVLVDQGSSVRIYGLKRDGGELFKKDFRKLLSLRMKILQENLD